MTFLPKVSEGIDNSGISSHIYDNKYILFLIDFDIVFTEVVDVCKEAVNTFCSIGTIYTMTNIRKKLFNNFLTKSPTLFPPMQQAKNPTYTPIAEELSVIITMLEAAKEKALKPATPSTKQYLLNKVDEAWERLGQVDELLGDQCE